MADCDPGKHSTPFSPRPPRPAVPPKRPDPKAPGQLISCRATNPLSLHDDLGKVFLDEAQAKATTATRLFRNEELLAATGTVVGEFIAAGRAGKFCMWSTGCSSGEEVYSMGMIALREFEKRRRQPYLEAFGTDINRDRIMEARDGVYLRPSKDAFAPGLWRLLDQYAVMDATAVQMGDTLREVCRFTLFDMRNRPKKHTFHFIVCNHVLQYYDAPGQRHIIGNLISVLKPGGRLYLEGVTGQGMDGLGLVKLDGIANTFAVGGARPFHPPGR